MEDNEKKENGLDHDLEIQTYASEIANLKKKMKKDDEMRKNFQEIARKKEEELKKAQTQLDQAKSEISSLQEKLQQQKTMVNARKDTKIAALEARIQDLTSKVEVEPEQPVVKRKSSMSKSGAIPPSRIKLSKDVTKSTKNT